MILEFDTQIDNDSKRIFAAKKETQPSSNSIEPILSLSVEIYWGNLQTPFAIFQSNRAIARQNFTADSLTDEKFYQSEC